MKPRENRELSRNRELLKADKRLPAINSEPDPCRIQLCALHKRKHSHDEDFAQSLQGGGISVPEASFYTHRIVGGNCDYCHTCINAAAGVGIGAGFGMELELYQ